MEPRRRRRVAKLLRTMDRREARSRARRPDGRHRRAAAAVAVLVVMLGGLSVASMLDEEQVWASFPDRAADGQGAPIGAPPKVAITSDQFSYVKTQNRSADPVTYDPCVPIHLVVSVRTMVDGGMQMLQEALDEVRDATGLVFVVDGLTNEPAPAVGGNGVAADGGRLPVRVAWSDPEESAELVGAVAGIGGSTALERDGHWWYVTGQVVLDGPQLAEIVQRPRGWQAARAVVMHELAHVVGLDHVHAPGELMQPSGDESITSWGDGDRTGLAALGRGACVDY